MLNISPVPDPHLASQLRSYLMEEIFKTLGFKPQGFMGQVLWPFVFIPANRFAQIAAEFDARVGRDGFPQAAAWALKLFVDRIEVSGQQGIPHQGPLIVASNHPGTYDSIAIASCVPRNDLQIIVSGVPFFQGMPTAGDHFLYAEDNPHSRMGVVRAAIRHLRSGGSLLIFPTGRMDPDPAVLPGAAQSLKAWSKSLQIFLQGVPECRLVLTTVSGVLAESSLNHPLVKLRSKVRDRQRVAEFIQVMLQLFWKYRLKVCPRITFDQPVGASELYQQAHEQPLLPVITARAEALLAAHLAQAV
jgi:hypothetical protein